MPSPEVSYQLLKKRDLKRRQRASITELKIQSLEIDFHNRDLDIQPFIKKSDRSLVKPNSSVGKPLSGRKLAYARPLSLLAIQDGKPIAHLPIADNASSRNDSLFKRECEIQAKLHAKEYHGFSVLPRRYVWLGYAAISPAVRNQIATHPNRVNPLDFMIALGTATRDEAQPVAAYPWDEEATWKYELDSIGLEFQPEQDDYEYPFGPNDPVHQERWLASSVGLVMGKIMSKDGAEAIVKAQASILE